MTLTIYFAKSKQSKLILFFGLISLMISLVKYLSLKILIAQAIIFYLFMNNTDCNIYGKCNYGGVLYLIISFIIMFFLICDYFGIFNEYKRFVRRFYALYDSSNSSNFKNIIFPEENNISNFYKKRQIPKIINKNFRHKTVEEELDEDDKKSINNSNPALLNTLV